MCSFINVSLSFCNTYMDICIKEIVTFGVIASVFVFELENDQTIISCVCLVQYSHPCPCQSHSGLNSISVSIYFFCGPH